MKYFLPALALLSLPVAAHTPPADTLRYYNMEEAVVTATPKETTRFRQQPVSAAVFGKKQIEAIDAKSIKHLGTFAPNFYMPDYGSRLTSAVYIRGIGSRINTPAVGLYVDNIPFSDKSAYDFSFLDVERVDVLRGPQGTLYGRNSMGGLIRIATADPMRRKGTDICLGAEGRRTGRHAKAVTYLHPADNMALSVGGFYEGEEGFYRNKTTGKKADSSENGGGKIRAVWEPTGKLRLDLTASYEHSKEAACPYFLIKNGHTTTDDNDLYAITQNRQSTYRRDLLNTGLGLTWQTPKIVLSSITAYQYLKDRLFMDQDFTSADIFSLTQHQRIGTLSEELSLKSRTEGRWKWTSGAFFMYQEMTTRCPVTFYNGGIDYLNRQFAAVMPQQPAMSLSFTDNTLPFQGRLNTPVLNAALFHQSTVELGAGLSIVAGLRLDYDHRRLTLQSGTGTPVNYRFSLPAFHIETDLEADPTLNGRQREHSWQLLPKLALQYNHKEGRGNVYFAISKGYRSGGYNIQSYSDLSQTVLQRSMMGKVKDYSIATINRLPLPEASKQAAIQAMTAVIDRNMPDEPAIESLTYKPEQSWNYELGGHLSFFDNRLSTDYTFFYMHTKDQQLARFAESGMGRVMVNAGKSRNCGAELAIRAELVKERLNISATYGYTNSKLKNHNLGTSHGETVDYSGNHVPFAPEHTLGATATFRQPLNCRFLKAIGCTANVSGAGRIYWDEANTFSQPFYALLGASVTAELSEDINLEIWGRNLTATHYTNFAFDSLNNRFAQYGNPRSFGININWHF